jgi:hypothetical protein
VLAPYLPIGTTEMAARSGILYSWLLKGQHESPGYRSILFTEHCDRSPCSAWYS